MFMNSKQRKTFQAIFQNPVSPSIPWADIETLLLSLGAEREEGNGSRVRFVLNGVVATFHRPHPQPVTDKGAVKSVRRFLENAGYRP